MNNKELAAQFGKNVRSKRELQGISQEKFALLANLDRSYVSRIELGKISISLEKAYYLADKLKCNIRELLPMEKD